MMRPEDQVNVVGQSMAAITMLRAIEKYPELAVKIKNFIEVSPMGLGGKDNLPSLMKRKNADDKRYNSSEKTDEDKSVDEVVMKNFFDFIIHHPAMAAQEGFGMAGADEYNVLNLLKSQGIGVGLIQGAQDLLNSNERVLENIARQAVEGSKVRPELIGPDGKEKLPEELTVLDTDTEEVKNEKRRKIIEIKMELQRTQNRVPIDSLKVVEGGHEIFGQKRLVRKILSSIDELDKERTVEDTVASIKAIREGAMRGRGIISEVAQDIDKGN